MNKKDKACPHCDYRTSEGFNLRIHIARVHEGKSFKAECPYCNKSVVSLDWHIEKYHKKMLDNKVELTQLVEQDEVMIESNDQVVQNTTDVDLNRTNEELHAFNYTQTFVQSRM